MRKPYGREEAYPSEESRLIKRVFDLGLSVVVLPLGFLLFVPLAALIKASSPGPVLHWSRRVGQNNRIFLMPKFRTMRLDTPDVATHLLAEPKKFLTPCGSWLRKTSLDELPQVWSVLTGEMSWVGPRPALFNQEDLIKERTRRGIHTLRPGITGWAQIHGRDELSLADKIKLDEEYLQLRSIGLDLFIFGKTVFRVLQRKGVAH